MCGHVAHATYYVLIRRESRLKHYNNSGPCFCVLVPGLAPSDPPSRRSSVHGCVLSREVRGSANPKPQFKGFVLKSIILNYATSRSGARRVARYVGVPTVTYCATLMDDARAA